MGSNVSKALRGTRLSVVVDFGVIVTCCAGDYIFAKGCCASIRYFMGNVPICLLIDGEFSLEGLPELYGAMTIRKQDVQDPFLRARSFGWGTTKMIALWESPFEYFLLIDADTIVWGDLRKYALFDKCDVILHDHGRWTEDVVSKWFFNTDSIRTYFPGFNPMLHAYANTGVMFMRRDIFDLNEYREMLDFVDAHPGIFFPGEQGFLNFMLFRAAEKNRVNIGNAVLQYIIADHIIMESRERFSVSGGLPLVKEESLVLHWCGLKPFIRNRIPAFTEPMTFFRIRYFKDAGIKSEKEIEKLLLAEEKRQENILLINQTKAGFGKFIRSAYSAFQNTMKGAFWG